MGRTLLAVFLGFISAMIVVIFVEWTGHQVYPPPKDLDVNDANAFAAYVASLPLPAVLCVLAAYVLGTMSGSFVAAWIGKRRPFLHAGIIASVMWLATIANLFMIPHPVWFSVAALLLIPLVAVLVAFVMRPSQ